VTGVSQWLIGIDCHPVRHAAKADPNGDYVRRWVPELAKLPRAQLHAPWTARHGELAPGVYPARLVEDIDAARAAFVARCRQSRAKAPAQCFSSDGCDLLTLPSTSGLSGPGIRALTERCFREGGRGGALQSSGKSRGKGDGAGKGLGKGSVQKGNQRGVFLRSGGDSDTEDVEDTVGSGGKGSFGGWRSSRDHGATVVPETRPSKRPALRGRWRRRGEDGTTNKPDNPLHGA